MVGTVDSWLVVAIVVVTVGSLVAYRLLAPRPAAIKTAVDRGAVSVKTIMMVIVSILVLGSSLYVILSKQYEAESQKWAFGVVGTILGFWLRPEG